MNSSDELDWCGVCCSINKISDMIECQCNHLLCRICAIKCASCDTTICDICVDNSQNKCDECNKL